MQKQIAHNLTRSRKEDNFGLVFFALFCMPLVILFVTQLITLQSIEAFSWFFLHVNAALLGWVLLVCMCAFWLGVTGKTWAAWLITALPCVALALINLYKTQINGEPLLINDFSLIQQFGEIASFAAPQVSVSLFTMTALAIMVVLLVPLVMIDCRARLPKMHRWVLSIAGVGAAAVLLLTGIGTSWGTYVNNGASSQSDRVNNSGVLVGLFTAWRGSGNGATQAPSQELLDQVEMLQDEELLSPDAENKANPETPTVIFLMSESFFDVTELPNVEFEVDPIANFHRIEEEFTSGKFISNTYCGGTGYVEMEVLTGLCSYLLKESDTLTSLPNEVYPTMPCITDVFLQYGYRAEFLHTYNNNLYNRAVIYDAFGFESVRFSDSFPADAEQSGGYLSDMTLAKEIVSSYENKGEAPMMMFAVSMENHQPYTADKYSEPSGVGISSDALTEEGLAVLDACAHGLMHADQALGYLTEYFAEVDEPVMIVFWGDHLPNLRLSDGSAVYEKLGLYTDPDTSTWGPELLKRMLSTDYVIWTNFEQEEKDVSVGSTLLGLQVLKRLDFELTDYYQWLSQYVAEDYTMYRPRLYVDGQGNASANVPEEYEGMISNYATAVYDIAYGNNELFRSNRGD